MWEYNVVNAWSFKEYGEYISESRLNELGADRWELVCIQGEELIFKRKIKEEAL